MGVYLYCVLPADSIDPSVAGLDGVPVRAVSEARVRAWISEVDRVPRPDLDRIRDHHGVIEHAMSAGVTPVPIRFGQVLADVDALRAHLAEHDYLADLERIAGAVEFGIRVLDPDAASRVAAGPGKRQHGAEGGTQPRAANGTAYLRALAERIHASGERRARALEAAHALDRSLERWIRERRIEASERPPGAAVAHLVQTGAAEAYEARAKALAAEFRPLRIVVTGPWPPYSFVG